MCAIFTLCLLLRAFSGYSVGAAIWFLLTAVLQGGHLDTLEAGNWEYGWASVDLGYRHLEQAAVVVLPKSMPARADCMGPDPTVGTLVPLLPGGWGSVLSCVHMWQIHCSLPPSQGWPACKCLSLRLWGDCVVPCDTAGYLWILCWYEVLLCNDSISPFYLLELGFLLSPSGSKKAWAKFYVLSLQANASKHCQ
jgi:hypothetical protein